MTLTERISKLLSSLSVGIPEREFCFQLAFLSIIISEPFYVYGRCGSGKSLLTKRLIATFTDPKVLKFGKRHKEFPEKLNGYDLIIFNGFNPEDAETKRRLQIAAQDREDIPLFILGDIRPETALRQAGLADRIPLTISLPESLSAQALCHLLQNQCEIENFTADKELTITTEERRQWLSEIKKVTLSEKTLAIIGKLADAANKNNLYVSIRQWMSLTDLIKAAAYFNGRNETKITDTFFLGTAVWGKTSSSKIMDDCYSEILKNQLLEGVDNDFDKEYKPEAITKRIEMIARTSNNLYDTHTLNGQSCLYYRITINGEPTHLYVPLYRIETEEDFHPFNERNIVESRVLCNYHGTSTCTISIDSSVKEYSTYRAVAPKSDSSIRYEEFAKLPTFIIKENDPEIINKKKEQLTQIAQEIKDATEKGNRKLMSCKKIYQELKASKNDIFCNPKTMEESLKTLKDLFDSTAELLRNIKNNHANLLALHKKLSGGN